MSHPPVNLTTKDTKESTAMSGMGRMSAYHQGAQVLLAVLGALVVLVLL
jgi:hypothetical protein